MRRLLWIPVVVALAGCGGDSGEAPAAQTTPEPTPAETAAPAPPERARSVRDCVKLWNADGPRWIAWFVAERGYAPFSVPERRNLEAGERVVYNGRALRDGRIELR